MTTPALTPRLSTRVVDERSIGFLVAGASQVAARWMLAAIREQPPAQGSQDVAGAWVSAVYGHSERRVRQFAADHRIIHASTDLEALLQRATVHCVYVGNQPRHHAETVRTALEAHRHVLCEPPLALTLEEAESLHQMATNRGLILALNYTWRATAAIHQLHTLLLDDTCGELLGGRIQNVAYLALDRQTWRLQPDGGGVLYDRTLHDIDLMRFLLHVPVREVYGRSTRHVLASAGDEDVVGYAVLTGGIVIQLHDSFVTPHVPVAVELYGANGAMRASHCAPADAAGEMILTRSGTMTQLPLQPVNPYRAAVARFIAAVRGAAPPLATSADEIENLAALDALRTAILEKRPVAVLPHTRQRFFISDTD